MVDWKCQKVAETDFRPHGGEGLSIQYLCKTREGETGSAYAIINPTNCFWAYLATMPTRRGIGTTILPQIEREMIDKGCAVIYLIPETRTSLNWLIHHGYEVSKQSDETVLELKKLLI